MRLNLARIGIGIVVTLWISALIIWSSGFLWSFSLNKILATIVLVGVTVYLAFQLVPRYIDWHQQTALSDTEKGLCAEDERAKGLIMSYLRSRARRLRLVAVYALVLIVLVITSGIYLLKGEESLRSFLNPMQQIDLLFEDKASIIEAIDIDERRLAAPKQGEQLGGLQGADKGHYQNFPMEFPLIDFEANTHEGELTSCDAPCRATRIKVNKARLADIDRRIEHLMAMHEDSRVITEPLFTSAVTKVTAALLLLILMQMLISLYRYSTRLAAFYDSRADMLLLLKIPNIDANTLVAILMPDLLGFEKVKVGLLSDLIETIQKVTPFAAQKKNSV